MASLQPWCLAGPGPPPPGGLLMFSAPVVPRAASAWLGAQSCGMPRRAARGSGLQRRTLRVFSIPRGRRRAQDVPHTAALTALAFSADGEAWAPGGGMAHGSAWPRSRFGLKARPMSDSTGSAWPRSDHRPGDKDGPCREPPPHRDDLPVLSDHTAAPPSALSRARGRR